MSTGRCSRSCHINRFRRQALARAGRITRSVSATRWLATLAGRRGEKLSSRLGEGAGQVKLLAHMLYDWATGRYPNLPGSTLLSITGALVYFMMPLDAIPDPILALGLLDDLALLSRVWKQCQNDIGNYKAWREQQVGDPGGE
ncbi:YkvA family protein [Alcanivorax sp. DP30]|uniref:YkvA family protein n=1 Tax=Alcanivorax sp. DP30 TaxID=2606217 RepID=UPI00136E5975|nr:DUF1232 domain-containing protein [Alcanivorax sp. DP30]MZR61825.1 DUF1232 domain-containing protein [Alcanivorax sp. DP30]